LSALRSADDVLVVVDFQREVAFEGRAEVRRLHRLSVRVTDAGAEPEGVRAAAVGRRRQRRGEVGHELRSGEAAHLVERGEAVAGHLQERQRVRVGGNGGIDGVDGGAPMLEPL
jgi:hypothetical protein